MIGFDLDHYIQDRGALFQAALDRYTPDADTEPAALHAAMRYSLFLGGKRVRPLLCIAGAEAVGGQAAAVLPMACALEMIHTFSLIHDDLPALDNDDLRRGAPTSHRKFGEAMAILAGDALHTLAFRTIAGEQKSAAGAETVLRCVTMLADACGDAGMVGGQVDDLAAEGQEVSAEALKSIHARKTGALLLTSILSGAILCGATPSQEESLAEFGRQIGMAFQIVDDILDVVGDDATLGKPAGSDARLDKATYPKLFGLEESRRLARAASNSAIQALDGFGDSAEPLRAFARYIVERNT